MVWMSVRNGFLVAIALLLSLDALYAGTISLTPGSRPAPTHGLDGADRPCLSHVAVHLAALPAEFGSLLGHAFAQCRSFIDAVFARVVAHVLGDLHGAELGAAHGTEMRGLGSVLGQGFVVEFLGLVGIEAQIELVLPAEFEARLGQRIV